MYDAIILAGGECGREFRLQGRQQQQYYEALIEIAGKPMVTFVAQALADSGQVNRIIVAGPAAELTNCLFPAGTIVVAGGQTIMDTIGLAMAALGHDRKTIVATADIPLLTAAAVNDFLAQCSLVDADLYYPIIAKAVNDQAYPAARRTYVRLREGAFTGGNLFLVNPAIVPQCMTVAQEIINRRKSPFQLCRMLGWLFVARFILGRLTLEQAAHRASNLLGIRGAVLQSPYPEIGIDVGEFDVGGLERLADLTQNGGPFGHGDILPMFE